MLRGVLELATATVVASLRKRDLKYPRLPRCAHMRSALLEYRDPN